MAEAMSKEEIEKRSQNANQIFSDCMEKLRVIRKKQTELIKEFFKKTDAIKIEKIKKEIGGR